MEVGGTTLHPTYRTKALNAPAAKLKVHMNDLQLPGVSWLKDTPPFLPWGHVVHVRAQRPGLHVGQL